MRGIIVDCRKGEIKEIDDGLPAPQIEPVAEPEGIDLDDIKKKLAELDALKARIAKLEKAK